MNSRDLWFFMSITFFTAVASYSAYSLLTAPDAVYLAPQPLSFR